MAYGICTLSVVPARKEPSGTSEMVTQLLFGEHYTVIENGGEWLKIKTAFDDYHCWISTKQHAPLSETSYKKLQKHLPVFSTDLVQVIHDQRSGNSFPITI